MQRLVLKQSGHLQLSGHLPSSDLTTGQPSLDDSSPTPFHLLMEGVFTLEREAGGHNSNSGFAGEFSLPYVGPRTLNSLLENFCWLYSTKRAEVRSEVDQLKKALGSLERTEREVERMRGELEDLEKEEQTVSIQCSQLLEQLTHKSCQVSLG